VLRRDGCIDVRIPAVLAALLDAAAQASSAAAAQGTKSSSSSSSSQGDASRFQGLLQGLVSSRCRQLLQGVMPTSIESGEAQLRQLQGREAAGSAGDALMCAVLEYRLAKKQVLQQFAGSSA
jgi:hypothetical protein